MNGSEQDTLKNARACTDWITSAPESDTDADLDVAALRGSVLNGIVADAIRLGRRDGIEILPSNGNQSLTVFVAAEFRRELERLEYDIKSLSLEHYFVMGEAPRCGGGSIRVVVCLPCRLKPVPPATDLN